MLALRKPRVPFGALLFLLAARHRARRAVLFVDQHFAQKSARNFVNYYLLTFPDKCGIIYMSRGRENTSNRTTDPDRHQVDKGKRIGARGTAQTLSRKKCTIFSKPLDKYIKVWYNRDTKEKRGRTYVRNLCNQRPI